MRPALRSGCCYSASGCTTGVDPALVKDIRKNPENYYVNVHSSVFQPGAIRGQLG